MYLVPVLKHMPSIFKTLGQKLEVLLSIFCGTKITLEWITSHFWIYTPSPPLYLTLPLILNFFQLPPTPTPLFSILKSPYTPPLYCEIS